MLWKIALTVEGKRLSDVLESVEGKVVDWNMRAVKGVRVEEEEPEKGQLPSSYTKKAVREIDPVGGSMADKVAHILKKSQLTAVTRSEICSLITEIGGNPTGISYYVANLRNAGILGNLNKETKTYTLLHK